MAKRKEWVTAVAAGQITGVISELQEYVETEFSDKLSNKILMNLLQHLSHAALKYDRSKTKLGTDVARLTSCICSHMTVAMEARKFFSSIYHIAVCLVEMRLYKEGMEVCDYLLPKWGLCEADGTIERSNVFGPTSTIWYRAASDLLKNEKSLSKENYELYMMIMEYDLKLTRLAYENFSTDFLTKVLWYSKKIVSKVEANLLDKYKSSIVQIVRKSEITLKDNHSENTWQSICELIPLLIGKELNSTSVDSVVKNYTRYFDLFRQSVMATEKYSLIFALWERLCEILLRRVENFEENCLKEIGGWLKEFKDLCRASSGNVLKSYVYAVSQLLSSVLSYWDEFDKKKEKLEHLKIDMIIGMLKLSREHSRFYSKIAIANCRCQMKECNVKNDVPNELVLEIKCLSLISCHPALLASETITKLTIEMVEPGVNLLMSLKNDNCGQWTAMWRPWGASVYNVGASCENTLGNVSICLYEHLIRSIVSLVGFKTRQSLWGFEDPLGTILHRLFSVCVKDQQYERAKRVASINCLLSHDVPETKAFRDWAYIKHKDSTATNTTILEYLRNNELEIPEVNVDDYDLVKVCLREIKALQESQLNLSTSIMAVLDELERLQAKSADYAQGVQLLGYHALNFETNSGIEDYLQKAISRYRKESTVSVDFRCAYAMIKFYEFVERTRELRRNTEADMAVALNTLTQRNTEPGSYTEYDVVPAYMSISMTVTSDLESSLKEAFIRWQKLIDCNCFKKLKDWEARLSLHTIMIASEYSRLHHFEHLERDAWNMVYNVANQLSDSLSIVYAASRILTSPHFHLDWIARTEKHAVNLESSSDQATLEILMRYRLSLARFYFENNAIEKAEELMSRITSSGPEIKFMTYFSNFLLLKDIEMKFCLGRHEDDDQSTYAKMIVQCLYTLLGLDETAEITIYGHKETQLYNYEILLEHSNNLALRMNSLLSYREICAHLIKRLSTAQKLVASLRVAECLKFLCYIDLSRAQLEDCGAKLQGLEHILEIEAFDATMQSELLPYHDCKDISPTFTNPMTQVDVVRDVGQSDTSPVLRTKVFAKPHFMIHGDICSCFKCTNTCYQYLVFACTHIRAQLFALQNNSKAAFQHFLGALEIKKCILVKRRAARSVEKNHHFYSSCPQHQRHIIEDVMFRLDYCRFLDSSMPNYADQVTQIALDALQLCDNHKLHNHPLYVSLHEFLFQRRFEKLFTKEHCAKFMVPDLKDIDVSRYERAPVQNAASCVTPVHDINEKKPPISVRRRKTPPFLSLDRRPIDPANGSTSPTSSMPAVKTRRLPRKICKDYDEDDEVTSEKPKEAPSVPAIKITPVESDAKKPKKPSSRTSASKRIAVEKANEIVKEKASVSEVTKMLENTEIDGKSRVRSRKKVQKVVHSVETTDRPSTKLTKKIDQVTELMNEMSMEKKQKSDSLLTARLSDRSQSTSDNSDSSGSQTASLPSSLSSAMAKRSETDKSEPTRRASARLRKKDKDTGQVEDSKYSERTIIPETDSEDEVSVVRTRIRRRLYVSKESSASTANKIVKNSRSRSTKSQDG